MGLRVNHEPSNLIIGGGLDDVWYDPATDEVFVVDYKSTAGRRNEESTGLAEITLNGVYKEAYKRQMDMYQWILTESLNVSNTGYFAYVNGDQHFEDGMLDDKLNKANMKFDVQLISYEADDSWVENIILN